MDCIKLNNFIQYLQSEMMKTTRKTIVAPATTNIRRLELLAATRKYLRANVTKTKTSYENHELKFGTYCAKKASATEEEYRKLKDQKIVFEARLKALIFLRDHCDNYSGTCNTQLIVNKIVGTDLQIVFLEESITRIGVYKELRQKHEHAEKRLATFERYLMYGMPDEKTHIDIIFRALSMALHPSHVSPQPNSNLSHAWHTVYYHTERYGRKEFDAVYDYLLLQWQKDHPNPDSVVIWDYASVMSEGYIDLDNIKCNLLAFAPKSLFKNGVSDFPRYLRYAWEKYSVYCAKNVDPRHKSEIGERVDDSTPPEGYYGVPYYGFTPTEEDFEDPNFVLIPEFP